MDPTAQRDQEPYIPALNRSSSNRSSTHKPSGKDTEQVEAASDSNQHTSNRTKRKKSLVRRDRDRVDVHHRQFHCYRHAAAATATAVAAASDTPEASVAGSTTNSQTATRSNQQQICIVEEVPDVSLTSTSPARKTSIRRYTANTLRQGQSMLGRSTSRNSGQQHGGAINFSHYSKSNKKSFGCQNAWMIYCYFLTCCIPNPLLRICGIPSGPAQAAWREKIGLVSLILLVMGLVGFFTFAFSNAVCPDPPLPVKGGDVGQGYLIVRGWAYMLGGWTGHPAIGQYNIPQPMNVIYPPVNAGGMDATFMFQDIQLARCRNIFITADSSSTLFPCQLFNPNDTMLDVTAPSSCHTSGNARSLLREFRRRGVPQTSLASPGSFSLLKASRVYYDWESISKTAGLMVYDGDVVNLNLLKFMRNATPRDQDGLISHILANPRAFTNRDMTKSIVSNHWVAEAECLHSLIKVGSVDTLSIGCIASQVILDLSLAVILGVILTRFTLAVLFNWLLSWRLGNFKEATSYRARMQRDAEVERWAENISAPASPLNNRSNPSVAGIAAGPSRKSLLPQRSRFSPPRPASARYSSERVPSAIWKRPTSALEDYSTRRSSTLVSSPSPSTGHLPLQPPRTGSAESFPCNPHMPSSPECPYTISPFAPSQPPADFMPFNFPLAHTICLVTCYSEGFEGVRTTLDSIALSDYPNSHKLILVVCDGMITGHGETMSTPEVCLNMMENFVVPPGEVEPAAYIAIADGLKRNNMGKVYAGFYKYDPNTVSPESQLQRVPMITVVKCGLPEEQTKPGNRGKRDSQMILMQFMQKVMFNERMTRMEYELFCAIWQVSGIPADRYELAMMIDADTKLFPDALSRLVSCAVKDPEISGLCGETKIANKTGSWVCMIQVFEYYISHHQSKAFESVFGGVTCLPGCFCMYRIKAPKGRDGYWVPILANPDIIEHYSENVIDTLHKKNLLLLGEDRYLSTLMLKTFPNRKMVFVPQAVCKTVVPDSLRVLLSQRRRWINSTIHNLMELVFVHDLCGTFCFSMQFVVFMELVGTLALPAAISFTAYLVVMAILGQPSYISLILLGVILGLPSVLVLMTSRKLVYVGWMVIYVFALPIWNFLLPVYAFWHFDDFSWGDTRKVQGHDGEKEKCQSHGDKEGEFDAARVTMKKWADYEKERRVRAAIERQLPIPKFESRPSPRSSTLILDSQHSNYSAELVTAPILAPALSLGLLTNGSSSATRMPRVQQQQHQHQYQPSRLSSSVDIQ